MDDDDFDIDEGEETPPLEGLNWADIAWSLLAIPYHVAQGFVVAIGNVQKGLVFASMRIDEKKKFAREVGVTIEALGSVDE